MAEFLTRHSYRPKLLWLGDYISKDDDVGVEDVGKRMGEVIDEMIASGDLDQSFDMIVHRPGRQPRRVCYESTLAGRSC